MDVRQFPDFANTQEWNLVGRSSYQAQALTSNSYAPITAQNWLIQNSNVLIIGVSSVSSGATWRTGGWARQILSFLPSTASNFVAAVHTERRWLRLGTLTLCVFPKLMDSWILEISFPFWFQDATVEVWRYDGRDIDVFQRLDALEADINSIQS